MMGGMGVRELIPPCWYCGARYTGDLDDPHICKEVTFGTWVSPPDVIPFTERPEPPGELREEDAAKVLAVFRELGVLAP